MYSGSSHSQIKNKGKATKTIMKKTTPSFGMPLKSDQYEDIPLITSQGLKNPHEI